MNTKQAETNVATLAIMQALVKRTPYNRLTKTNVIACEGGYAELSIPYNEELAQHHGYLHGSLVGYLADNAISWAAASVVGDVVTSEYRIHLLSPGIGDRFVGRGQVIKSGKRLVVARSDVFAVRQGEEKLIATATGTVVPVHKT